MLSELLAWMEDFGGGRAPGEGAVPISLLGELPVRPETEARP